MRCHFHENVVREFTPDGSLIRALPASVDPGLGLYALAVDGQGHLWAAAPTVHRVACYAMDGSLVGAVGGSDELVPGEFDHPEDVVVYDGAYLFVSDMGHRRVAVVDTHTLACGTYRVFEQPVWGTAGAGVGKWSTCKMACTCSNANRPAALTYTNQTPRFTRTKRG